MTTTLAERKTVAKKMGRPKGGRNDAPAKIDKAVVDMAKHIARTRGITVAEYLTGLTEGPVRKDYKKLLQDEEEKKVE